METKFNCGGTKTEDAALQGGPHPHQRCKDAPPPHHHPPTHVANAQRRHEWPTVVWDELLTVSAQRWRSLKRSPAKSVVMALSTEETWLDRRAHMMRARRRDQLELIVPFDLPGHHSGQAPVRRLTLGSCHARAT